MATHKDGCVFKGRVELFQSGRKDTPARFGVVMLSYSKLSYQAHGNYVDVKFHFCPECGVQLKQSPYGDK